MDAVEFLQGLKSDQRVVVCAHVRPDGDAVGSTLALVRTLHLNGVDAYPLLAENKPAPRFYSWLVGFDEYLTPDQVEEWDRIDALIVLDTPVVKRLGAAQKILERADRSLVIDHHPELEDFGDIRIIDQSAAATAQIVWDLIVEAGLPFDKEVATASYCGLASDTGRFMFSNTSAEVFRSAAQMLDAGVDINDANVRLFSSKPAELLTLEALVLERMMILNNGKVTCSWLTQDDFDTIGVRRDEAESIIDLIRSLEGSEVSLLVIFGDTSTRVSLRSKTDADVGSIAESFGGGGHRAAAGINWPEQSADLTAILDTLTPLLPGA
ncbi:MAG: bifunctional oligoribonuclease/PAP phosphatase NrnA [Coriobacteriia bacterium]|nr:bifunctional oligoribonuclease/PAP phosphatase NrnA [Coriobacteriia bacterium]